MSSALLRILSLRGEPSEREPTPDEWIAWAGGLYAVLVRAKHKPIKPCPAWAVVVDRECKLLALHLFVLAHQRGEEWEEAAERWQRKYLSIRQPDPEEGSAAEVESWERVQRLERLLRIRLAANDASLRHASVSRYV